MFRNGIQIIRLAANSQYSHMLHAAAHMSLKAADLYPALINAVWE